MDAEEAYAGGGSAGEGVGWKRPCFSFKDALFICWVGGGEDGDWVGAGVRDGLESGAWRTV